MKGGEKSIIVGTLILSVVVADAWPLLIQCMTVEKLDLNIQAIMK